MNYRGDRAAVARLSMPPAPGWAAFVQIRLPEGARCCQS